MEIKIQDLNIKKNIEINENFSFNPDKYKEAGIKDIKNIKFVGILRYNIVEEIILEGKLTGEIILYDSVDLSDFLQEIDVNIEEILENNQNVLDISEVLWNNIVLEVPIRSTNKKLEDQEGNGWKILNEVSEEKIDPRLEKLQELFKGGE